MESGWEYNNYGMGDLNIKLMGPYVAERSLFDGGGVGLFTPFQV